MATLTKKRDYKNGGASYGIAGVRGSIYISTGLLVGPDASNKVVMPASIDLNVADGFTFAIPNAKAEERAEAKAKREADRAEKKAKREAAKINRAALRGLKKAEKEASRTAVKEAREAERKRKADEKQAKRDAKAAAKAAKLQAQLDAVKNTPLS